MARSLVRTKQHKAGGLWVKWAKLRESSYDEWMKGLPAQAGEELILEMTMLVMEDPTDAEVAASRVEDLVQQILRVKGMDKKIGAMTVEWCIPTYRPGALEDGLADQVQPSAALPLMLVLPKKSLRRCALLHLRVPR